MTCECAELVKEAEERMRGEYRQLFLICIGLIIVYGLLLAYYFMDLQRVVGRLVDLQDPALRHSLTWAAQNLTGGAP